MEPQPRLARPPIIEAILIIAYDAFDELDHRTVDNFYEMIREQYPLRSARPLSPVDGTIPDHPDSLQSGTPPIAAHLFTDAEDLHVVQVSGEGFMFHQIRDYTTFEHFGSEARRLWEMFSNMRPPRTITRISLRYINDIHIPEDSFLALDRYMQIRPTVPGVVDEPIVNGLLRIGMKDEASQAYGVVTQTWNRAESGGLALILDMEASAKGPHSEEAGPLWGKFQQLRELKNHLFLSSITDTTRSFFQ